MDIFAVLGIDPKGPPLNLRALRSHVRMRVEPHFLDAATETASGAFTLRPAVADFPTLTVAKRILFQDTTEADSPALQEFWRYRTALA